MTENNISDEIIELLEFGRDNTGMYTKVAYTGGNIYKRYGDLSKRNNNPGNLVSSAFTRERGDLNPGNGTIPLNPQNLPSISNNSSDAVDRFAVFPTIEKGTQAISDLIFTSNNAGVGYPRGQNIPNKYNVTDEVRSKPYKDRILLNALKAYAPYDGKGTDPIAYAQNISKKLVSARITQEYIDSAPIGNYSNTAKGIVISTIISQEGARAATHIKQQEQSSLSAVSSTDIASYVRRVYLQALQDRDPEEYATVIRAFETDTIFSIDENSTKISWNTYLQNIGVGPIINQSPFAGELAILNGLTGLSSAASGIQGAVVQRLQSVGNFTPSEQYFLLYKNYFEINPERMRNYMMVNADGGRDGRPYNLNYSHAWRAPAKLAVTANITIPGASGFRIGQIFWVGRTYETYKKFGAFQLFGLTETIDMSRGWTTELYARFNAMPLNKVKGLKSL